MHDERDCLVKARMVPLAMEERNGKRCNGPSRLAKDGGAQIGHALHGAARALFMADLGDPGDPRDEGIPVEIGVSRGQSLD
ncbi:MAG: hypothetical protein SNJ63_07510, partial [Sphingomonadaceae bacterium]